MGHGEESEESSVIWKHSKKILPPLGTPALNSGRSWLLSPTEEGCQLYMCIESS